MRPVDGILTNLATRLSTAPGLQGADAFFPDRIGALPRAVLLWTDSKVEMPFAGLLVSKHDIDVYVLVEPRSSLTLAVQRASQVIEDTISHLYGDVTLGGQITQLTTGKVRPATLRIGGETYYAAVIKLEVEDKSTQAVG